MFVQYDLDLDDVLARFGAIVCILWELWAAWSIGAIVGWIPSEHMGHGCYGAV